MEIAEKLSLIDVGNLMSCCRVLAYRAKYFYKQRRAVNMSCFKTVTPEICNRVITRFSRSCLAKLHFCYDIHGCHRYDEETVEVILAHSSFSTNREIVLCAGRPRRVEILAYGYFLNKFLSSQQHLQCLEVGSDGWLEYVRGHWRAPRILEIVGRNCPGLERYTSLPGCLEPPHVQTAFLQSCPRLKSATVCFLVGIKELDTYATLPDPLELREASFSLRWDRLSEEERRTCGTKLRILGSRLHKIESESVILDREGSVKDCMAFLKAMPPLRELKVIPCALPATGPVFVGVFSLLNELHHVPPRLELNNVAEEEFEKVVEVNALDMLPKQIKHLKIFFKWRSRGLDKAREKLLDKFMDAAALRLTTCTVGVTSSSSKDQQPAFLKTFKHRNICNKKAV